MREACVVSCIVFLARFWLSSRMWRDCKHLASSVQLAWLASIFDCFKVSLWRGLRAKVLSSLLVFGGALALCACSSLPEGAVEPKLTIDKVSINEQGSTPKFIVLFSLEHASATALPLYSVSADIFIRDQKVATITQQYKNEQLPPHEKLQYRLEVPANLVGQASLDSLLHNSLLMLQGSCALSITISTDPSNKGFNPSRSYYGLISVE